MPNTSSKSSRVKPSETSQIEFIKDCLRKGQLPKDVLSEFGKKWRNVSKRTFERRLKVAVLAVTEEQRSIQAQAEGNVAKKVEALESKIMTAIERKQYLTKIISGEVEIPYTEIKWDANQKKFVTIKFVELAPHTARISAIAELNKMDGDYAPIKQDLKITGTKISVKINK